MSNALRETAENRLEMARRERSLADPRPALRLRLKALRDSDPDAFERARRYYEEHTLGRLAEDDPIEAWIEYARTLGELAGPGRLVAVDATGRARDHEPPAAPASLVLFLPADDAAPAFAAVAPASPSPAQQAAYALLVSGRVEV